MGQRELPLEDRPLPEISLHQKKKLGAWGIVGIVWGAAVLLFAALCVFVCTRTTVFPHTSVLGVDMSGLTPQQACAAWEAVEENRNYTAAFVCDGETLAERTLAELGVSVTPNAAAESAYQAGRSEGPLRAAVAYVMRYITPVNAAPAFAVDEAVLDGALRELVDTVANTVVDGAYELRPNEGLYLTRPCDGMLLDAVALKAALTDALRRGAPEHIACSLQQVRAKPLDIEALCTQLHGEVAESRYDRDTGGVTPSRIGVECDAATLGAQLAAARPGETFLADAAVTFPKVSDTELSEVMFRDVIGTATTKVSGSWSRINNVKLAAEQINGNIYNPGEEFWYNAAVGERTEARGFGAAPSYVAGETVDSVGGGICQVSSTLYLATLRADLEIVLRYCHQFVPGYITWGCDATVSWGGCDYAFRNSSDYPIKIVTEWNDNQLTVSLLGTKTDDTYVEMSNSVLSSEPWSTRYVCNDSLPLHSDMLEVQTPYTGYYVKTYRNTYAADGTLLSSVFEANSHYEARDRIYEVDSATYAMLDI